jgi:hypothetical protein
MRRLGFLFLVAACGAGPTPAGNIPFAADFEGYASWQRFELRLPFDGLLADGGVTDGGTIHDGSKRTVYINQKPAVGSTVFADGTLIVKEQEFEILAMAKRGGTYNAGGAVGWEWLELRRAATGALAIKWRGLGPPLGEEYKASAGTCNDCHKANTSSDSVLTPGLQL